MSMLRLLRIEWNKIAPYRAFRVLIGLYLVSMLALPWAMERLPFLRNLQQLFEFPSIWFFLYFAGMFLSFALAIIVITITCNEYTHRTFRQHVIDGLGRDDLVIAKLTIMGIGAVAITALITLNGLLAGMANEPLAFSTYRSEIFAKPGFIPGIFLHVMGVMTLAFFLANLLRRTGLAIFAFLLWVFPLELILRGILEAAIEGPATVANYLPVWVIYNTNVHFEGMENPFDLFRGGFIPGGLGATNVALKLAWIALLSAGSWGLIRRRDL